jgi:hypothetical protein
MRDSAPSTVQVRLAQSEAERHEVYRFRYRVLVTEMGMEPAGTDHAIEEVREALDSEAKHLTLWQGGILVAAIRMSGGVAAPLPQDVDRILGLKRFEQFGRPVLTLTDRLVIAREHDHGAAPVLLGAAYKLGRRNGGRFDFTHCAPGMVRLYEQLGYRRYTACFVDQETGYRVPMVLLTEDLGYLRAAHSPLAAIAAGYANVPDTGHWFARAFPDYAGLQSEPVRDEQRFWSYLCERLRQSPTIGIPLFAEMDFRDVRRFLSIGTILRVRKGDTIVRNGTHSEEMYVVLSGAVEAQIGGTPVAGFGQGDVFGEIAFLSAEPRTADVIATDDAEVLVLTQDYLQRAMAAIPEVAAKVLFNLSLILCRRLKDSTQSWLAARAAA